MLSFSFLFFNSPLLFFSFFKVASCRNLFQISTSSVSGSHFRFLLPVTFLPLVYHWKSFSLTYVRFVSRPLPIFSTFFSHFTLSFSFSLFFANVLFTSVLFFISLSLISPLYFLLSYLFYFIPPSTYFLFSLSSFTSRTNFQIKVLSHDERE